MGTLGHPQSPCPCCPQAAAGTVATPCLRQAPATSPAASHAGSLGNQQERAAHPAGEGRGPAACGCTPRGTGARSGAVAVGPDPGAGGAVTPPAAGAPFPPAPGHGHAGVPRAPTRAPCVRRPSLACPVSPGPGFATNAAALAVGASWCPPPAGASPHLPLPARQPLVPLPLADVVGVPGLEGVPLHRPLPQARLPAQPAAEPPARALCRQGERGQGTTVAVRGKPQAGLGDSRGTQQSCSGGWRGAHAYA